MPPKQVTAAMIARVGTSNSTKKSTSAFKVNKPSVTPKRNVASSSNPENEPHPKRQKTKASIIFREFLEKLEEQEKSEPGPDSWVDTAAQIIEKGKDYQIRQFDDHKFLSDSIRAELERLARAYEGLAADLGVVWQNLSVLPLGLRWESWSVTRHAIDALLDAHDDDIEGSKKVLRLFQNAETMLQSWES